MRFGGDLDRRSFLVTASAAAGVDEAVMVRRLPGKQHREGMVKDVDRAAGVERHRRWQSNR